MNILAAFIVFDILIIVYELLIQIFSALYELSGLTKEQARFQVTSLLTGTGFTTSESEKMLETKKRRRVTRDIMIVSYIFNISIISTLITLLTSTQEASFYDMIIGFIVSILIIALLFIMKKVAVLNDLSGFGKCSLTAAIPVLSALGVQCCPLPSAVLTNQTGYEHFRSTDLTGMIPDYTKTWQENGASFDGIYSGYMTGRRQIEHFSDFLDIFYKTDTFLLVDPVMGDDGHTYGMYSKDLLDGMKELSKRADVITPNLTEACLLCDYDIDDIFSDTRKETLLPKAAEIAQRLRVLSGKDQDVIVTGIKCKNDKSPFIYNLIVTNSGTFTNRSHFFDRSFSGTGDLFASVVCGCHINGMTTQDAVELASSFIYHSIADTMNDDVPPNDGVNFEKFLIELIKGGTNNG